MTIQQFDRAVKLANLKEADRKWFPKWIRGYALFHRTGQAEPLELDQESVIAYLRHLRDRGTMAWQRKRAAKALETSTPQPTDRWAMGRGGVREC